MSAAARRAARRARFAAWASRLRLTLAREGMRLALDAPDGAAFDDAPLVKVRNHPGPGGTLTLRIGRDVHLGRHTLLELWSGSDCALELGEHTLFWQGAHLWLRGGSIRLGRQVQVRDHAVLKSDGELRLGDRVVVGHASSLACTERIDVGDRAGLGERVSIVDSDHAADGSDTFYLDQPLRVTPVRVGRNVLVSANVTILRGADIGDNAVVGAGAVVTAGEHAGGWLHAGVPARPVRQLGATARTNVE